MRGITVRPEMNQERYYSMTEACAILEMEYTSFWRAVKRGDIRYKLRPNTRNKLIQGKELIRFWKAHLMPIG